MEQKSEQIIKQAIKKSALQAGSGFDYRRLEFKRAGLVDCEIREEKEEVLMIYNISGLKSMQEVRSEKRFKKLLVLLAAADLSEVYKDYYFSLSDENLYYNRNGQVLVLSRDVYGRGMKADEGRFVAEYKALIGYVIQKKYGYEDYLDGGLDLMKKDKFLAGIVTLQTLDEIKAYLEQAYEKEDKEFREERVEVGKNWRRLVNSYLLCSFILVVGGAAWILYMLFIVKPRTEALLQADNAYMESDYIGVVDALEKVNMKYLDKYKKYILSVAYVKGENLSDEQKENILSALSINGDEKLKEYWIYLGRLDVKEAENIALQKSDDQLLLYSYLMEKSLLEKNTELSGEEKAGQLSDLENKIERLAKMYESAE